MDFVFSILGLPFRMLLGFLRGMSELVEWFLHSTFGAASDRPWWQTLLLLPILSPYWLWKSFLVVLAYPLSLSRLDYERRINVYYGIPAVLAMLLILFAILYSLLSTKLIDDRYRVSMQRAIAQRDFESATILGGRLVQNRNNVDAPTRFEYAIALAQNGERSRSEAIMADLAPNNKPGFGKAHFIRARAVAAEVARDSNAKSLANLRWHLENCLDDRSEEVERLWAVYYHTVGQPEYAIPHLERAAMINPRLYLLLATLYSEVDKKPSEIRALKQAEAVFRGFLAKDPVSIIDRVSLASTLVRLNRPAEAEDLMVKGAKMHNDNEMRRSVAQFYLTQFDINKKEYPNDLATQFSLLEKAFRFDLGLQAAYERLIDFYKRARKEEEGPKIKEILKQMLIDGNSTAFVHFGLSSIYQMDGDTFNSNFHLIEANRQNQYVPSVINNLAWMMLNQDPPDLSHALEYSERALSMKPRDPNFLDTLGTIYMKQEKYHDAIAIFESILSQVENKIEIHRKLATIYGKLGRQELAEGHAQKAIEEQQRMLEAP